MNQPATVSDLLTRLLDKGHADTAGRVVAAISRNSTSGILAERLKQFDAEAKRLADLGKPMTADNPVFRALQADLETVLQKNTTLIDSIAPDVQAQAADAAGQISRQLALPGMNDAQLKTIGVEWVRPDAEAVARLVDFSGQDAWNAMLDQYRGGISDATQELFLRGIVSGKGPIAIARELRDMVEGMPVYQANAMARTLQLQSYRAATAANYVANADILEPTAIRIAVLDDRTCIVCVELHGTEVPIDAPIECHWNCRCTSVPVLRGHSINVQSGEDWFDGIGADRQRAIMGGSAWSAWQDGAVELKDFVAKRDDPVFGKMVEQASLKSILGDGATRYYKSQEDS